MSELKNCDNCKHRKIRRLRGYPCMCCDLCNPIAEKSKWEKSQEEQTRLECLSESSFT